MGASLLCDTTHGNELHLKQWEATYSHLGLCSSCMVKPPLGKDLYYFATGAGGMNSSLNA